MAEERKVRVFDLSFLDENSCDAILQAAARFYTADMKLKPYDPKEGERLGDLVATVPTLGAVAACKDRK